MENSKNLYKLLDECLCCKNTKLVEVLDLGHQPLANSYTKTADCDEITFPLKLNYCELCTHLQLSHAVNPDLLFKNYLYVSGTTKTLRDYFNDFVNIVNRYVNNNTSNRLKVLEIACNDGSQLDSFKLQGYETYGIDPAKNLYEITKNKHNIICDYLSNESISKFNTKFNVIVAENVFAHNSYPIDFLNICKQYIEPDGYIFIQTSQADMIKYNQFDTIYHEHISFFNANSMQTIVNNCNLYLNDIIKTPIHGNSYIFVISKKNSTFNYEESKIDIELLNKFKDSISTTINDIKDNIQNFKKVSNNNIVVGYGAAAKGNTVLNHGKIKLDYIVDDNILKQGLYTPGMKIPIVSLDFINSLNRNIAWIPLSWNFFDEIKFKIEKLRKNKHDIFFKLNFVQ